jgi:hypothetical protein
LNDLSNLTAGTTFTAEASTFDGARRFFVLDDGTVVDTTGEFVDRGRIFAETVRDVHDPSA